jgi:anti-sigma regulatory factor (Ser/Thr protein kinase)
MHSRVRALYKIEAQAEGPSQARRIIAEELSALLSPSDLDDMKLMVSELVTNGIVHGRHEDNIPVMLDLCVNGDIRCAVLDHGPGFAERVRESERRGWGWGLRLVELLSDRWGMQCSPRRTEVWFERGCDKVVPRGLTPLEQLA